MLRIRMVEQAIARNYPKQEMRCPVHLSVGQEAIAVGVCAALKSTDIVMSGHRSHAHYIAKGGCIRSMLAEIHGKETGCCKGLGGSMHLIDMSSGFYGAVPIVGSTIPIAVGTALGNQMQSNEKVAVAFFGDGSTEEGVLHESLNFAAIKKLPVIFVCENNFYSVYSPLSVRQAPDRKIHDLAKGHGIESYSGNGNNIHEVFEMANLAIQKARNNKGPIFMELTTYRWLEHCGPNYDNHIGYRTEEDFKKWMEFDPIETLKNELLANKQLDKSKIKEIKSNLDKEIENAFQFAKESSFPKPDILSDLVYHKSH